MNLLLYSLIFTCIFWYRGKIRIIVGSHFLVQGKKTVLQEFEETQLPSTSYWLLFLTCGGPSKPQKPSKPKPTKNTKTPHLLLFLISHSPILIRDPCGDFSFLAEVELKDQEYRFLALRCSMCRAPSHFVFEPSSQLNR